MNIPRLRKIMTRYGVPGTLFVGVYLLAHYVWRNQILKASVILSAAVLILLPLRVLRSTAQSARLVRGGSTQYGTQKILHRDQEQMDSIVLDKLLHENYPYSAADGESDAIAAALVQHGASLATKDERQTPPLLCAASREMHRTVSALLARGVDVNARDIDGYTALLCADAEDTTQLLQHGADPNIKSRDSQMPLFHALDNDESGIETVRLLLDAGANPNACDEDSCTPLMNTHYTVEAELLLKHGAEINATDREGRSVLFHAQAYFKMDPQAQLATAQFLERHGAKHSHRGTRQHASRAREN